MSGLYIDVNEKDIGRVNRVIQQIIGGRLNVNGEVTLTANAASTVVTAGNCGEGSAVLLQAQTANAAAAVATTYISAVSNGSFTITHANNAQADKTFFWVALG